MQSSSWPITLFQLSWLSLALLCRASEQHTHYQVTPLAAGGAEITRIDLKTEVRPAIVQQIKTDLHHHGFLVFRDQGEISGDRQVIYFIPSL